MKKNALLFIVLLVFAITSYAQNTFQLGLQLSPGLSWLNANSDHVESDGNYVGFSYGLIADINFAENYSFSTGLLIESSGVNLKYADKQTLPGTAVETAGQSATELSLSYIEIPLVLKLKTNQIGYLTYFGQFGLGLGFNYDAEADIKFSYPSSSDTYNKSNVDFSDEINLFRVGLVLGLGVEYNISGNTAILVGLTYNNGFTNILKNDSYEKDSNGNATGEQNKSFKGSMSNLLLNLGVLF